MKVKVRETEQEDDEMDQEWTKERKKKWKPGKGDKRYVEAVFFIPHTPNSELKKALGEMEEKLGYKTRVKYQEELGRTVSQILVKKDPSPEVCGRKDCFSCRWKPGYCQRPGPIYNMMCQTESSTRKN